MVLFEPPTRRSTEKTSSTAAAVSSTALAHSRVRRHDTALVVLAKRRQQQRLHFRGCFALRATFLPIISEAFGESGGVRQPLRNKAHSERHVPEACLPHVHVQQFHAHINRSTTSVESPCRSFHVSTFPGAASSSRPIRNAPDEVCPAISTALWLSLRSHSSYRAVEQYRRLTVAFSFKVAERYRFSIVIGKREDCFAQHVTIGACSNVLQNGVCLAVRLRPRVAIPVGMLCVNTACSAG